MNFMKTNKVIKRLNQMVENAMGGHPIENGFDETQMSALETKLSQYLSMNYSSKAQLAEEKMRIHELISDISHQTKTPIANLLLYAQLLEESDLQKNEMEYVKSMIGQAEKLNFLLASLIKVSRLETGVITVSPKNNKVQSLLDEVMNQAILKAKEKCIILTCDQTEISALFDLKWTAEALYNIVDNAIKYTDSTGRISISITSYSLFCRIDVRDTGVGISEEETAKIYFRFYRSPSVSEQEGVGIGLYLAREIINGEGGYIKVQSKKGKGSLFSVFLPMPNDTR